MTDDNELTGLDFRGRDLMGADFTGANLMGAKLKDAVILERDLDGTNPPDSHLEPLLDVATYNDLARWYPEVLTDLGPVERLGWKVADWANNATVMPLFWMGLGAMAYSAVTYLL